MNWTDIISTLPELALSFTALVLLMVESMDQPPRSKMVWIAQIGVVAALVILFTQTSDGAYFQGMIVVDAFSRFFDIVFIILLSATMFLGSDYLKKNMEERGEYFAILLFTTVGLMFMTKAQDLTITFLGLELASISLYILVAFDRNRLRSNEAGVKYLLLGAFATGFFLFGIALIYGSTGTTHYDGIAAAIAAGDVLSRTLTLLGIGLLMVGFGFKVALVPFHMYVPDVYQGAPTSTTAILATGPKIAGLATLLKLTTVAFVMTAQDWTGMLWILSALTMVVGNIIALQQDNIKRMLAYSSIAHTGYIVIAILTGTQDASFGLIFYVTAYGFTTLGAFGIVAIIEGKDETGLAIDDYKGLSRRNPYLAAGLTLALLSLAGFPPTAGFLGKFFIFNAAIDEGYTWLIIIAVMNSLVSVYYYLRPVIAMYMTDPEVVSKPAIPLTFIPVFLLLILVALGMGIFPMTLINGATAAAMSLF